MVLSVHIFTVLIFEGCKLEGSKLSLPARTIQKCNALKVEGIERKVAPTDFGLLKIEESPKMGSPISMPPKLGALTETIFGFSQSTLFLAESNFAFSNNAIIFELVEWGNES